jgi:glycosyltransferase involved in cell wall biosynthesis
VRDQFEEHFDLVLYTSPRQIECDALYAIKRGTPSRVTDRVPELNHAFEDVARPHGHRFAAISDWLARTARRELPLPGGRSVTLPTRRKPDVVPLIVTLPDLEEDYRAELGIPEEAVVFGRHGGGGSFDLDFVKAAIRTVLEERQDVWFAFLNTWEFHEHERLVHIPRVHARAEIRRFVNTLDYAIHAHELGEGFGLTVAESAYVGVPVMTYLDSPRLAHLDLLRDGMLLGYRTYDDVLAYLRTLGRRTAPVDLSVRERYAVEPVTAQFERVFLQ